MKKILFTLLVILSGFEGYSQLKFHAQAGINYSLLPILEKRTMRTPTTTLISGFSASEVETGLVESYESRPGFRFGLNIEKKLNGKFSSYSGLNVRQLRFKRVIEVAYEEGFDPLDAGVLEGFSFGTLDPGMGTISTISSPVIGSTENFGETTLNLLEIPVGISYKLNEKFRLGFSFINSFLLRSKEVINQVQFEPSEVTINPDGSFNLRDFTQNSSFVLSDEDNTSGEGYEKYQLNTQFSAVYELTADLNFLLSFEQGITSIFEEEKQAAGDARLRAVLIGVSYFLK